LRDGTLWSAAVHNLALFGGTFPRALALPAGFSTAAIGLALLRGRIAAAEGTSDSIRASLAFLIVAILFYGMMGFYDPRLTATLIPPLIVIVGSITRNALSQERPEEHWMLPEPIVIAAIAYVMLVIFIPGPYA
jgi:hypothetical protein